MNRGRGRVSKRGSRSRSGFGTWVGDEIQNRGRSRVLGSGSRSRVGVGFWDQSHGRRRVLGKAKVGFRDRCRVSRWGFGSGFTIKIGVRFQGQGRVMGRGSRLGLGFVIGVEVGFWNEGQISRCGSGLGSRFETWIRVGFRDGSRGQVKVGVRLCDEGRVGLRFGSGFGIGVWVGFGGRCQVFGKGKGVGVGLEGEGVLGSGLGFETRP
ncbi:hypothetical protein TIFTF001_027739 [Ficus carica]|uniref:Uncharacterized protein n=1 Tax=Ficus carica TaxID=3494 RepID=A0AA88DNI5_FICCA|nr:hypothetical protein TIFTF001_027739 [Ficus carica]